MRFYYKDGVADSIRQDYTRLLHRLDGPAVENDDIQEWYKDGKRHRDDGPAYCDPSLTSWWKDGKRHRLDGPAMENRNKPDSWWVNGGMVNCETNEEFLRLMKLKAFL